MIIEKKLEEMGLTLPEYPEGQGVFDHVKEFGPNLAYVAGCGPEINGVLKYTGRVDKEVTMEQAKKCAVDCTLNFLRALQLHFGDLDRIKQFVKMTVFVACDHDFKLQPEVGDACTGLLKELYGEERGVPARSSIGQAALPYGFPVEIEVMVEYE